jgi:uncharacterized protein (DUF1778 family)
MAQAKLVAEVGADITRFEAGMNRLGQVADQQGKKIASKFSERFGAGMLTGVALAKFQEVLFAPAEVARTIGDAAADLHVTAEEYQMLKLAADNAQMSISDFVALISDQPGGLQAAIAALEQYRQQINFTNGDIERLAGQSYWQEVKTSAAIIGARIAKWAENKATAMHLSWGKMIETDIEAGIAADEAAQKLNNAQPSTGLQRLLTKEAKKQPAQREPSASVLGQSVTSRQQIGAFIGTTPDIVSKIDQQTEAVKEMRDKIVNMDRTISEGLK